MSMDSATRSAELTPRQTFSGVVQHSLLFVIVIGIGVLFLGWFSGTWALGAKIGFWLTAALTVLECIHVSVSIFFTITLNVAGKPREGERWMVASNAVQLAGAAAGIALVLFLRSRLWG
jgi:hypothetical protein